MWNRGKRVKRRLAAGLLGLFLTVRLVPAFSVFWANWVSMPALKGMAFIGSRFPFALLEWGFGAAGLLLIAAILCRRLWKTLAKLLMCTLALSLAVWYPLYFLPRPAYHAGPQQVSALCEALIDELNASIAEFQPPGALPAKFVRFPEWMNALEITGLCSFLTGEALISPELETISRPFVAVHERMHLNGYADEGAANIAAWEECISRGGAYAASARVWALRYGMGLLRRTDPALYERNLLRMNHAALQAYRAAGGAWSPAPPPVFLQRLYAALGIETTLRDYEILASYLAAGMAQ